MRYCYFSEVAMDYTRNELKSHVVNKPNICIGLGRQGIAVSDPTWNLVTVSINPIDANIFRRGGANIIPLYIYPQNGHQNGDSTNGALDLEKKRRPNFSLEFIKDLESHLEIKLLADAIEASAAQARACTPEQVFYYMYAVFHSPAYRSRYAEFLKMDFPRLPLTTDLDLFQRLAEIGGQLAQIHLMQADLPDTAGYPIEGNNIVDKPEFKDSKVYINKIQYFEPVEKEVWEFHIGGYQVAHKWLKDRKGRKLSDEELEHYLYILAALKKTMELMEQIDETIPGFPLR